MPIAEDSAGGSPVPIPTNLTTNLTGEATGSGTLDYTTGDIDIVVTVVDNGHNHILSNITDVQVNNAISGQILVYNGTVWANATNTSGITALVQDTSPQLGGNLDLNNRNITGTGNIAITGTIDGRDVSADGTKLDGIESGATADQTAAQIKTAYESNANTNNFADADVSKLSGIEPGATADQTAAQIKTAYESNSNTNAFTDADHTKLDGIETAADVTDTTNVVASLTAGTNVTIAADGTISATGGTSGIAHVVDDTSPELGGNLSLNSHDITGTGNLNFTGNLTLSGTVDGRDVAADGTKLDGIEASADVTDTANVTAAGALMDSEVTNLAQVKAFDSSDYATATQGTTADAALPKAGGTMTGDILFNDSIKAKYGTSSDLQIFHDGSDSYITESGTGILFLRSNQLKIQSDDGLETYGVFTDNGSVQLYHNNVERLETNSVGVSVTGVLDIFDNNSDISPDGSGSGQLKIDGNGYRAAIALDADGVNLYSTSASRPLIFGVNETEVARVTTTGLGIGTTSPQVKLQTTVANSSTEAIRITNDTDAVRTHMYPAEIQAHNSNLTLNANDGGFATVIKAAGAERMRINSTGVGIGTTSPNHELHIESTSPTIRLVDTDGNNTLDIGQSGSACYVDFDNTVRFRNLANVERLRIDTGGIDVTGVTKTSGSGYNPANTGWATNASLITSGSYGGGLTMIDGSNAFSVRVDTGGLAMRIAQGATSGALNSDIAVFTNNSLDVKRDINTTGNIYLNSSNQDSPQVVWQSQGYGDQYIDNYQGRLRVVNSGAEQLSISQGGNMHIYGKLDVSGNIDLPDNKYLLMGASDDLQIYHDGSNSYIRDVGTGDLYLDSNSGVHLYANGSENMLYAQPNAGVQVFYDNVKKLETTSTGIDVTGKVSASSMDIENSGGYGNIEIGGGSGAYIDMKSPFSDDYDFRIITVGTSTTMNGQSGNLILQRAGSSKLSVTTTGIDVTGDLLVSSTIEVGSLTPNQDGAIEVGVIALGTPAISSTTDSTSLRNHIIFDNPNGAVGKINTLNSSTSYLTSSDYRLKTDVQEMTGSIDRVKALRPVNFEWVVDGTRVDGFLAHEAQEVVPEAVDGEKDAMRDQEYVVSEATGDIYTPAVKATYETIQVELTPAVEATYDDEGNELTPAVDATYEEQQQELTPAIDEVIHSSDVVQPDKLEEGQRWRETTEKVMATRQVPDYQGIDQSKIVPLLTSALQDAIAKIEALETRLEALES